MRFARNVLPVLFALSLSWATHAQQDAAAPAAPKITFDTVSVKQNKTMDAHPGSMIKPDGFDAENITPIWVLYWAFGQKAHPPSYFSGLPDWANSERFDIIAKVSGTDVAAWGCLADAEKQRMVRDVFATRFGLQYHTAVHQVPVYALVVVGKNGAKLTPAKALSKSLTTPSANGFVMRPDQGWFGFSRSGVAAGNMTMGEFAQQLSAMKLGRPVQDRTELTGRYDFKLDFAPVSASPASPENVASTPDALPDIFTAVQEQLGLKLAPSTGPVDTIVIDHMDKPSEN